jgi:hypothetical protein
MIKYRVVRTSAAVAIAAGTALGLAATAVPAVAGTAVPASYAFRTLNNGADGTFNQLLGINNHRKIVGYYGSGAPGHPNQGYQVVPSYGQASYQSVNFPGAAQTEVTGLNDNGVLVGFFSRTDTASGINGYAGFYLKNGGYHRVAIPAGDNANPAVNELLGINNSGIAVGDYTDDLGNMHGYLYNINTHHFTRINISGLGSLVVTAINNSGTVVGYFTNGTGGVVSFLRRAGGRVIVFARHGADQTQAFGINDGGEVVGAYAIGNNSYGFTWRSGHGFSTVNDPSGVGSTVINGVNNGGELVGFYTNSQGNTNGMLAVP